MFGAEKFRSFMRHPGFNGSDDAPPPPDTRPLAEASKESSQMMAALGKEQLDFAKTQYEEAKPFYAELVTQQKSIADQTTAQGKDYYDYGKSYRPVERSMMNEAMGMNPDMVAAMTAEQKTGSAGILAGLVDETQYKADLAAAKSALGLTPSSTTSSTTTKTSAGSTTSTGGMYDMWGQFSQMPGFDTTKSASENITSVTAANPEYAAAIARMTEAQKRALAVGLQNEQLRSKAAESDAAIFDKYAGQASRTATGKVEAYDAANQTDAATITQTDGALYDANQGEVDAGVGRAVADVESGYTRSLNQAMRQGLRYGASGAGVAGKVGEIGLAQASMTAGAANAARTQGITDVRGRAATRLQLRQSNVGQKNSLEAVNWAKKLDAAGLVKGMPGASQGAYGLALSAGNSSAGNRAAPGNMIQGAMGQNANLVGQGRNLLQSGLGGVINAQTAAAANAPEDQTGAIVGGVAGIAIAI